MLFEGGGKIQGNSPLQLLDQREETNERYSLYVTSYTVATFMLKAILGEWKPWLLALVVLPDNKLNTSESTITHKTDCISHVILIYKNIIKMLFF